MAMSEDEFCIRFASELIMPEEEVRRLQRTNMPICEMANYFGVTNERMLARIFLMVGVYQF